MYKDKNGAIVKVGDRIQMPGVPFVVVVDGLEGCEPGCEHGAAQVKDPVTQEPDAVCLAAFVVL